LGTSVLRIVAVVSRVVAIVLLALTTVFVMPAASAAGAEITPKARALFKTGVELLEDPDGPRYEDAYRAFKSAYEESPSPRILGNLGLCAMKLERDGEAIEAYRRYLIEADEIDAEERAQIQKDLRLLEHGKAKLKLEIAPKGAVITDERTPAKGPAVTNRYGPIEGDSIEIDVRAGNHRVVIEHPDGTTKVLLLELEPGKRYERTVELNQQAEPTGAAEPTQKLPIAFVKRPMTLPEGTLSAALGARYGRRAPSADFSEPTGGVDLLAGSYGILDDLQLDVWPLPIEFLPRTDYGTSSARLSYRYLDAVVELGSNIEVGHYRGNDERRVFLDLSVLGALAHLGNHARLDSAFELTFLFRDPVVIGMNVPLEFAAQPSRYFYFGLASGVGIFDFQRSKETVFIPVGGFVGGTVPADERPLLDVGARFNFHRFFSPGSPDRKLETRAYTGALVLRLYFYL
jgi:hypothetical protein